VKSKLSELMDGELDAGDAEDIFKHFKNKDDLRNDWASYHLIGDALRQPSALSVDISQSVSNGLVSEPTIFAPYAPKPRRHKVFAFSAVAASVVIMVGWLSLQTPHQPQQTIVADRANVSEEKASTLPVANTNQSPTLVYPLIPADLDDYLFVHGEFSPGFATYGLSTQYLHPVNNELQR
jgi:sigma-E factor negative regulatory protein RseA